MATNSPAAGQTGDDERTDMPAGSRELIRALTSSADRARAEAEWRMSFVILTGAWGVKATGSAEKVMGTSVGCRSIDRSGATDWTSMQRARAQWAALAAVTAAALITSSCTSAGSYAARGPRVRVTVNRRCPDTLGGAKDVSNPPGGLGNHLVPTGDDPRVGLVCQYAGSQNLKAPATTVLARSTALSQ
jgi:hypothetical protein